MAARQTSVAAAALGFPGMLSDATPHQCDSRVSEEASAEIPFGTMVIRGADEDNGALQLHTSSAATVALLAGIVVHTHNYAKPTQLGDIGLKPGVVLNLLQKGRIWVTTEDACDPGDTVKVRAIAAGAEVKGAFRVAADASDCVDISKFARWITSAGAGGVAMLEIDMTNASQATAD